MHDKTISHFCFRTLIPVRNVPLDDASRHLLSPRAACSRYFSGLSFVSLRLCSISELLWTLSYLEPVSVGHNQRTLINFYAKSSR